jgi:hypothetical protein
MKGKSGSGHVIAYAALREMERAIREHKAHIRQRYHLRTRFVVREGVRPFDEQVTIQCYRIVADKPVIVSEQYDIYPNNACSCMQVCYLSLVMRMDTRLDEMASRGEMPWLHPGAQPDTSGV